MRPHFLPPRKIIIPWTTSEGEHFQDPHLGKEPMGEDNEYRDAETPRNQDDAPDQDPCPNKANQESLNPEGQNMAY